MNRQLNPVSDFNIFPPVTFSIPEGQPFRDFCHYR